MDTSLQWKRLLVVNACLPRKAFAFERLHKLWVHLIVLHTEEVEWIKGYVNEWIIADPYNHWSSLQAIEKYIKNNGIIEGAMTLWEDSILLTSKIIDKFWWIGISNTIASTLKNKYLLKKNYNTGVEESIILHSQEDISQIASTVWYPAVIKPAFWADSSNVIKVDNYNDAQEKYMLISERIHFDENVKDGKDIIAEQYISWNEVDIDLLVQNGEIIYKSIADNDPTTEPYFIEVGDRTPSWLSTQVQEEIYTMSERIIKSSWILNGCIHLEAKYNDVDWPQVIEVNLRMWWVYVRLFNYNTWWVDLLENAAKIALWIHCDIKKPQQPLCYQRAKFFIPKKQGTIKNITIPEELSYNWNIVEIVFTKKVWDKVSIPPNGFDYIGRIVIKWSSREETEHNMNTIYNSIEITIE